MNLWMFGLITLGSFFIVGSWTTQIWKHRKPASIFNAALMMAVALDVHAIGMGMQGSAVISFILQDPGHGRLRTPFFYFGCILIIFAKSLFVWIASLYEGKHYSQKLWWSYITSLVCWTIFCIVYLATNEYFN